MQTHVLILLSILVVLLIGVIYFGWRKIINLEIENSRNKYDIEALRNLLSRIFDGEDLTPQKQPVKQMQNAYTLESMQFPTQVNVPNFFNQEKSSKIEKNLKKEEVEEESDIDTLESTDDNLPKNIDDESTVTVESLENSSDEETETQEESEDESSGTQSEEESGEDSDDEAQKIIENELALDEKSDTVVEEKDENLVHGDEPEEDKVDASTFNETNQADDEKNEDSRQEEEETKHDEEESKTEVKKKKFLPNELARNYKEGYRMKSSNDGKMYEVIQNGKRKTWKLIN